MAIWLLLSHAEGKTRVLNIDHIAEFQISADTQNNYTLFAHPIDQHRPVISIATSPDESQVRAIISQLFQLRNRSGSMQLDILVEIQDYFVQQIINF